LAKAGQAEVLILVGLLSGCGATTSKTTDGASTTTRVKIALFSDAPGVRDVKSTLAIQPQ
jgi:hypothetical protein